ncbi:MAG: OmpA family protein [Thiobacillus sp.]
MQIKQLALAVAATLVSAPLFAQQAVPQAAMPGTYGMQQEAEVAPANRNADQWMERMADFTKNAQAFKDPAVFAHWMNAMTDPSMVGAVADSMIEPGNWLHMMTTMMQPAAVSNYAQFMMDPAIATRWGAAALNPMFYTKLTTDMINPTKIMGWMMLPMDQRLMATSMKMLDPNLPMKFMMMPSDPRGMSLMFAPMNPQLYGSMVGGLVNPQLVGGANSTWGKFMFPTQPVVAMQPRAPLELPFNLMDPSSFGNVLNMLPGLPSLSSLPVPAFLQGMPVPSLPFGNVSNAAAAKAGATKAAATQAAAPAAKLAAAAPAASASATAAATNMTLNLGGDTLFKTGKSSVRDLTPKGRADLDDLISQIKGFSSIDAIKVVGHADKTGKASSNQKLSLARAKAVASYLKSKKVKAKSFTTVGMGDTKPVVDCDMSMAKSELKQCLAPNRRVEIEVSGATK